jgi:two-component system, NarL family, sensor histidine kinase DegS
MCPEGPRANVDGRVTGADRDAGLVARHAARCIELAERERLRIGFDLHDGPAQSMSAALLQIRMLEELHGEALKNGLTELRQTLAVALEEVYDLIDNLGARTVADESLAARVRACVEGFASSCDIEPTLTQEGDGADFSASLRIAVYRIVQEALSNVKRHSGARHVDIRLRLSPARVMCDVEDDGTGFVLEAVGSSGRGREPFGLLSMRERARMLDGDCAIDSAPGRGTRVHVEIPVWQG